jgi:pimeloyl-ACP methyl ester carboxylesterase
MIASEGTVGHYARVNGLELHYELHGNGQPLVLLHGGLGAIEMFESLLPSLAAIRQVVAVDLEGHGQAPLFKHRPCQHLDGHRRSLLSRGHSRRLADFAEMPAHCVVSTAASARAFCQQYCHQDHRVLRGII